MSKEMVLSPVYQLSEALRKCARRLELHSVGACDAFDCEKLLEYANNVFHQNQVELSVFGTSSVGMFVLVALKYLRYTLVITKVLLF